jgi:hypothetical protein
VTAVPGPLHIFARVVVRLRTPPGFVQRVERLPLGVDADVRMVLQHPTRQMATDRFKDVITNAQFSQFRDDRVSQIVEPEARQARGVTERAPRHVPVQDRLRGVLAHEPLRQIDVNATQMLHLDWSHRGIGRDEPGYNPERIMVTRVAT